LTQAALYGLVPLNPTTIWLSGGSGFIGTWNGKLGMSGADYVIADNDIPTISGVPSLFPSGLFALPSDPATAYFTFFMSGMPSTAYKTQSGMAVQMTFPNDPDNAIDRQISTIAGVSPNDFWYFGYDGHRFHYDRKSLKKYVYPN
jgi:hypothetical protein